MGLNSVTLRNLKEDLLTRANSLEYNQSKYAPKHLTFQALADKYNVNWVTVKRYNTKMGLQRPAIDTKKLDHDIALQFLNGVEIAEKYGIDVKTV